MVGQNIAQTRAIAIALRRVSFKKRTPSRLLSGYLTKVGSIPTVKRISNRGKSLSSIARYKKRSELQLKLGNNLVRRVAVP